MTSSNEHSKSKCAAFFDVDGTLIDTTIVHYFVYFRVKRSSRLERILWAPWFACKCAAYLVLDKINREFLNTLFYRNYAGLPAKEIKSAAADCIRAVCDARWLAGAKETIGKHLNSRHEIVLVTGSLDFLMAPLADELGGATVFAATLEERDGRFTGRLVGRPMIADEKQRRIAELASRRGLDLAQCHAYADSSADLPMLEAVGFPHAVNPDRKLRRLARRRGWPIHEWPVENSQTGEKQ